MDFRKYVSYEIPEKVKEIAQPGRVIELPVMNKRDVERALEEIASTPEGADLLRKAAAAGPDGKVNIFMEAPGETIALPPNDIIISTSDSRARGFSTSEGQYRDITLQEMLYHELVHIVHGHGNAADRDERGYSKIEEAEAVRETNVFVQKYYGQSPIESGKFDLEGTPGWDVNPDFNPERGQRSDAEAETLRKNLGTISQEEATSMGPEIDSLFQFRNSPGRFLQQLGELRANGSDEKIESAMRELSQRQPPEPVQNEFANAGVAPAPAAASSFAMKPL